MATHTRRDGNELKVLGTKLIDPFCWRARDEAGRVGRDDCEERLTDLMLPPANQLPRIEHLRPSVCAGPDRWREHTPSGNAGANEQVADREVRMQKEIPSRSALDI